MCGICGIVGFGAERTVCRMRETLAHRGPDSSGAIFFQQEKVGLGHRRLKIIDLSSEANQPMAQEDGSIWIVFNGEIYNFLELRKDLEARGHRFKSKSDTEVILHLYEEQGTKFFTKLNGIFALALLDRLRSKLFLARDQVGVKPLYYYCDGLRFVFGSEIKAILASGIYSPDLNWQGLYDYFTYLYVPSPETIFKGIFQVPPAHVLELNLQTHDIRVWRYWQVSTPHVQAEGKRDKDSYEATKKELRNLLTDSLRRQMVSDVPLGVFLSGGVDSPILTGLMAEASSRPVKTFTVFFEGENLDFYNERDEARAVAQSFATEHHEISVPASDPNEMLDLVQFFDQPFGNPTFYLMYLISRATRGEVTVALCGAGGDELFAGYPRYRAMALSRWCGWVPDRVLHGARKVLGLVSDDYRTMTLRRARQFLEGLDGDFPSQFVRWTYFLDEERKNLLLNPPRCRNFLPSDRIVRSYLDTSPFEDFGNRVLHLDLQTFLPHNILEYTDKMSMAVGLEVRVPYLDHRLVERSLQIPFRHKLRGGRTKVVLRDAFSDLLPDLNRRWTKKGFNAPLATWMRHDLDWYFDVFMGRKEVESQGIFNWEYLQTLREQHRTGRRDNSYELFSVMMFDVWYRKYILQERHQEWASVKGNRKAGG